MVISFLHIYISRFFFRYLVTGDQILSIALAFRCGESTVRKIIHETCSAIIKVLQPIYLRLPTKEEWTDICAGYLENWNFPHCIGSFDGKHVEIQAPPNSGSLFFNYKKTYSIVLLAACNHKYMFTLVDVGSYGGNSDGGIFTSSEIYTALQEGTLNIPKGTANLSGSNIKLPCFFLGDSGFPISNNMMRPYSGKILDEKKKIFNYRLVIFHLFLLLILLLLLLILFCNTMMLMCMLFYLIL